MLQKDSRNREEVGRGGGGTSAGEATARHSRRDVITPSLRAIPYTYRESSLQHQNPSQRPGGIKGPQGFWHLGRYQ